MNLFDNITNFYIWTNSHIINLCTENVHIIEKKVEHFCSKLMYVHATSACS